MTEDRDIMFHVFYRDQNGKKVDVVQKEKIECHLMMEEGEILCFSPRICEKHQLFLFSNFLFNNDTLSYIDVLRFDNTYSYFRSKTVWHWINLDNDHVPNNMNE